MAQLQAGLEAAGRPDASLDNQTPDIFLELIDAGGITQEEEVLEAQPPAPEGGPVAVIKDTRRRNLLQDAANTTQPGTCGAAEQPSRIIGFIFNSQARYKLKPVLKDTTGMPDSVSGWRGAEACWPCLEGQARVVGG